MANKDSNSTNIKDWLKLNLLDFANGNDLEILLIELKFLKDTLPEQFRSELKDEYRTLSEWIKTLDVNSNLTKTHELQIYENGIAHKVFLENIRKPHLHLKDLYLITFLIHRADSSKINTIRAVYFFLCLRMVELTDYDSRIETTLDECRFLTNKTREFLVPFLPDVTELKSLKDIEEFLINAQQNDSYTRWLDKRPLTFDFEIQKYKNRLLSKETSLSSVEAQFEINERIAKYLYEYILPIENYFKNDSGITRVTTETHKIISILQDKDDITGNTVSDLTYISENASEANGFEDQERQDDEEQSFEQVNFEQPTNYYLDKIRAEQQVNCRHQRTLSQVTDVNVAHADEVQILVTYLLNSLMSLDIRSINADNNDEQGTLNIEYDLDHQTSLYLLIILLTGRSELLISEDFRESYLCYRYPLEFAPTRSKVQENWDSKLCADNTSTLNLFYPIAVGNIYSHLLRNISTKVLEEVKQKASEALKAINKKSKTRLTFNKVKNYLEHYLIQSGRDQALVNVLISKPIHHSSALPYFNVSQLDLFLCQYDFNEHLYDIAFNTVSDESKCNEEYQFFELPDERVTGYWDKQIGSVLAIRESRLTSIVSDLITQINSALWDKKTLNPRSIVDLHNIFTDYLYVLLSVSSGYRPVREPFGRLVDIDVRTKKYFISDKENRQHTRGRYIYLPDIANQQIEQYIKYLKSNAFILNSLGNSLGDIYSDILDSNIGLITYLKLDEKTNTITEVSLTKTFIHGRLSKILDLPSNWHRHFIRSYKSLEVGIFSAKPNSSLSNSFGHDVIGAWMGHADELGFDYYDKHSGLRRSELRRFSDELNGIIKYNGFKVISLETR
ncbi:hypothetical protein ACS8FA_11845 [Psychrobacter sp. 1Y1]|uniref:hypothetical protein n=2 Tax=Psychrobacter TaxID=497 RepID=UPI003B42A543